MIRKRGDRYQVRVYVGIDHQTGRRRHLYATAPTKKLARTLERDLERQAEHANGAVATRTVDDLIDAWLDVARLEPSTRYQTHVTLRRHVTPRIGRTPLARLKPVDLDRLYRDLEQVPLAASTVVRIHGMIHAALEQAVRWEWAATNIADRARPPAVPAPNPRPPDVDDVAKLLAAADEHDRELAMFLRINATTGMRRGEMCALQWSDIDLDTATIAVTHALGQAAGPAYEKSTKAGVRHRIALDAATVDALRAYRVERDTRALACGARRTTSSYVFSPSIDGARPWRPETFTKRFARLRKTVGLEHVKLRELRHFAATQLLDAGVPVGIVAGRLGHRRTSTTQDIYAGWVPASDRLAADVLGALVDGQR